MIIVIGEILFDVFDDYKKIGGAPFNFAVHLKRMGFSVRFISRVGNDNHGHEILKYIEGFGFSLTDIQIDNELPTGIVNIKLDSMAVPEFEIVKNVAYDNIDFTKIENLDEINMIYFGTIIQRTEKSYFNLNRLLTNSDSSTLRFCDLNLRKDSYSKKTVTSAVQHSDILKLNIDELDYLGKILSFIGNNNEIMSKIYERFSLKYITLTNGEKDSVFYDGESFILGRPTKVESMVDTVGAGDAFASVLAAGILKKEELSETLKKALVFSSSICSIKGAIPEDLKIYEILKM